MLLRGFCTNFFRPDVRVEGTIFWCAMGTVLCALMARPASYAHHDSVRCYLTCDARKDMTFLEMLLIFVAPPCAFFFLL